MSARDEILAATVTAVGSTKRSAEEIASQAVALLAHLDDVRPKLAVSDTVECFVQRATGPKVKATVDRVAHFHELPAAVARYVAARNLGLRIKLQPAAPLIALDWTGTVFSLDTAADDRIVVGMARWGIAETGTLVVHSAADMPILDNFLGAVHIVAVHASAIVPYLEDYATAARLAGDQAPRNACLITGPSGTTDIEGSLVLGAHGPRALHIVVIDDASKPGP